MSARIRDASGLRYSAHGFGRGNRARSMMCTRAPAFASANPTDAPAGPPPTTRTSTFAIQNLLHEQRGEQSARRVAEKVHNIIIEPTEPMRRPRRCAAIVGDALGLSLTGAAPPPVLKRSTEKGIGQGSGNAREGDAKRKRDHPAEQPCKNRDEDCARDATKSANRRDAAGSSRRKPTPR